MIRFCLVVLLLLFDCDTVYNVFMLFILLRGRCLAWVELSYCISSLSFAHYLYCGSISEVVKEISCIKSSTKARIKRNILRSESIFQRK